MDTTDLFASGSSLAIACFVGLAIGIERTITTRGLPSRLGMRDFILVAILAFISSMLRNESPQIWPLAFGGVLGYALIVTVFENLKGSPGLVSVIAFPITFLIAGLVNFNVNLWFIATLLFLMLLVMGLKEQLHNFSEDFSKSELIDFATLIAISITITPLIPKNAALPVPFIDYVNGAWQASFHHISVSVFWKVVVMVSFMSFGAHFITKYIKGKSALVLATYFGGLVSSIATIMLLLRKDPTGAKRELNEREVFLGFVSANTGSLTKDVVVFFAVLGPAAFEKFAFPMVSSVVMFAAISVYYFFHAAAIEDEIKITDRPLPMKFIAKFSFVFACVMVFMAIVTHYLGTGATVLASYLSAIISSAASLAAVGNSLLNNEISVDIAGWSALASMMGSICAKYFFIANRVGWLKLRFAAPVAALGLYGFFSMWVALHHS
ncbi:MAG: MgtC/SapB family protein [Magnetococcales bacterium]|nr:MgtC/SapB family protein [Magnetococcales bacterium]